MKTGRGHNESRLHGIRKACARRSKSGPTWPARAHRARSPRRSQDAAAAVGEVVAADAAVVDSVATTAMPMSFEQAQLGANVTDPLLSRRRWPNGPGTEGHRIRGKRGAPQSACYGHATDGLSSYYPGRISTVTAIFPARIFKILCGFFRPEFSYIFSSKDDAWRTLSSS
jgi:hypothetical protein